MKLTHVYLSFISCKVFGLSQSIRLNMREGELQSNHGVSSHSSVYLTVT